MPRKYAHAPRAPQDPTDIDRAFFAANPWRRHYVRWAGDIEETDLRKRMGIRQAKPGRMLVRVRQIEPGFRIRGPVLVPDCEFVLPTSEDECAALFERNAILEVCNPHTGT